MLFQAKEKLQAVKNLCHSRHFAQCARLSEHLLAEAPTQTHPVHLAYLNFYAAMSHDTLAREAAMKNRHKELDLAEKHYVAAISALTPAAMSLPNDQHVLSSVLTNSWTRRSSNASSFDSTESTASSVTSYHSEREDSGSEYPTASPAHPGDNWSSSPFASMSSLSLKYTDRRILDGSRPSAPCHSRGQSVEHFCVLADTSEFIQAIQGHLASVRELKEKTAVPAVPAVRFDLPEPQSSTSSATPVVSTLSTMSVPKTSLVAKEGDAEIVRQLRRTVKFRERFDPTSVRRLCSEALWELP